MNIVGAILFYDMDASTVDDVANYIHTTIASTLVISFSPSSPTLILLPHPYAHLFHIILTLQYYMLQYQHMPEEKKLYDHTNTCMHQYLHTPGLSLDPVILMNIM